LDQADPQRDGAPGSGHPQEDLGTARAPPVPTGRRSVLGADDHRDPPDRIEESRLGILGEIRIVLGAADRGLPGAGWYGPRIRLLGHTLALAGPDGPPRPRPVIGRAPGGIPGGRVVRVAPGAG